MGPMKNPAPFIPLVLTPDPHRVAALERHSGGDVDIVRDQQSSTGLQPHDEPLVTRATVVVFQRTLDHTLDRHHLARLLGLEKVPYSCVTVLGCGRSRVDRTDVDEVATKEHGEADEDQRGPLKP